LGLMCLRVGFMVLLGSTGTRIAYCHMGSGGCPLPCGFGTAIPDSSCHSPLSCRPQSGSFDETMMAALSLEWRRLVGDEFGGVEASISWGFCALDCQVLWFFREKSLLARPTPMRCRL
jgi:hypothetical protein